MKENNSVNGIYKHTMCMKQNMPVLQLSVLRMRVVCVCLCEYGLMPLCKVHVLSIQNIIS